MEKRLDEDIRKFLAVSYSSGSGYGDGYGDGYGSGSGDGDGDGYGSGYGSGSGSGDGSGSGYGYGDGDGYGDGYGSGYGYGDGYGDGSGSGSGYGITEFDGQKVYKVDNLPTIICSVHGNYAKGFILNSDFTLTACFIAKVENCFAHGETLHKAMADAQSKALRDCPLEERIAKFKKEFPDPDKHIRAIDLYNWHNILTGSCEMGRKQFARDHNIDIENDFFTIREFVRLTRDSYGSEAIKQLAEAHGIVDK